MRVYTYTNCRRINPAAVFLPPARGVRNGRRGKIFGRSPWLRPNRLSNGKPGSKDGSPKRSPQIAQAQGDPARARRAGSFSL